MNWDELTIEPEAAPELKQWLMAADTIIMPAELWQKLTSILNMGFDDDGNLIDLSEVQE